MRYKRDITGLYLLKRPIFSPKLLASRSNPTP
jgi:hypothetical protein